MAKISIRIEDNEKAALQEYAKMYDLTISQVIRKAIRLIIDDRRIPKSMRKKPLV